MGTRGRVPDHLWPLGFDSRGRLNILEPGQPLPEPRIIPKPDPRERARLLDHGLDDLARYWAGEFEPVPVQRPRPPVWVAGEWPNRRPVRRALRWDGLFTIGLPGPEALAELATEIRDARPGGGSFDLITELPPDTDLGPWERAGLTWAVTFFGLQPTEAEVRAVIDAGPG